MCILFVMVLTGCQEEYSVGTSAGNENSKQEPDEDGKTWERVEGSKGGRKRKCDPRRISFGLGCMRNRIRGNQYTPSGNWMARFFTMVIRIENNS